MSCGLQEIKRRRRECRNLYSRKLAQAVMSTPDVACRPVVVAPPPTDAQVNAGTILGITSMFARGRY